MHSNCILAGLAVLLRLILIIWELQIKIL